MEHKSVWKDYSAKQIKECEAFCEEYKDFLNRGKTERECVDTIVNMAVEAGYVELSDRLKDKKPLKRGDKIYAVNMNKSLIMFNIGAGSLSEGMNILGAHIDSPRMDIKSNPLYEDGSLAYLDTHYYGGVKKYQWVAIPLALHGVVVKKDGKTIELAIGEDEDDPVFFVSDLLIHLASKQMDKKASEVIEGEALDIIVGNRPLKVRGAKDTDEKKDKDPVKAMILKILKDEYDIEEEDFLSAELEVVPAGKARDAGFDRSLILSYGQDDRVCAFSSLYAFLACKDVERTACLILTDKEEIGSVGATGMKSLYFENVIARLVTLEKNADLLAVRDCLERSCMLSSDVNAGFDPSYSNVFDKKNASYLGRGMVLIKYTGARGKSGSNDANAEYIAYLRRIFDEAKVTFQMAELGKVDAGGGGTIAYIMAGYGMSVIDAGVAILNMHAPYEASSKADVYETMRGYVAFLGGSGL